MMTLKESALDYAQSGFNIFPLSPLSKIPMKNTKGSKESTTDLSQIEKWWTNTPNANIGLVTNNFIVIDVDVHDKNSNGYESLEVLENTFQPLPKTLRITTSNKGEHIYLLKPDGFEFPQKIAFLKGIDIKAHPNNYVIAPPSQIKRLDGTLGQYKVKDNEPIASCPKWLIDFIIQHTGSTKNKPIHNNTRYRNKTTELLERLVIGAEEGSRNDTVASVTGQLLAYGVKSSLAWELVQYMNDNSLIPLDQKELETTFLSICRKEMNTI